MPKAEVDGSREYGWLQLLFNWAFSPSDAEASMYHEAWEFDWRLEREKCV